MLLYQAYHQKHFCCCFIPDNWVEHILLLVSCHEIRARKFSPDLDEIRDIHLMIYHKVFGGAVLPTLSCCNQPLRLFSWLTRGFILPYFQEEKQHKTTNLFHWFCCYAKQCGVFWVEVPPWPGSYVCQWSWIFLLWR